MGSGFWESSLRLVKVDSMPSGPVKVLRTVTSWGLDATDDDSFFSGEPVMVTLPTTTVALADEDRPDSVGVVVAFCVP